MGLLDELQQEQEGKKSGLPCRLCTLSDPETSPLGAQDARELAEALATRGIQMGTLITVLERRGIEVTKAMVGNHRLAHVPGWAR